MKWIILASIFIVNSPMWDTHEDKVQYIKTDKIKIVYNVTVPQAIQP
jgi:hypothetical protein